MNLPDIANVAREACLHDPVLLWAILVGNFAIFVAYMWIPISCGRVLASHTAIPLPAIWVLGGGFVVCCGFSHLAAVIVIFRAYYGLEAGTLALTAFVSLLAAWTIHRGVPAIRQHLADYHTLKQRVRDLERDLDKSRLPSPPPPG